MAVRPQLQWSLDRTAENVFSVSKSILEAATRDNVQVLPLIACQKFGATLAMTEATCDKVQKTVLPTPPPAVVRFIQALIGYYKDDSAVSLGENRAGIQFLGLACALVTTIPLFDGATALEAMLRRTASMMLVPTKTQLKELLLSLEPRCSRAGYADSIVRYQVMIGQRLFVPSRDGHEPGPKLTMAPSPEAIEKLVYAFRELGRIGEATTFGAEIEVTLCAPWVAAFTEWCLGEPSIYLENDKRVRLPIIENPSSKVSIVIPQVPHDSALQMKVTIMRKVDGLEDLLVYGKGEQYNGMVGIEAYGKWLLHDCDFDHGLGERILHSTLPHAMSTVLSMLTFHNFTTAEWWPNDGRSPERPGHVSDHLMDLCPRPFPELQTITDAYARMLNMKTRPDIRSRGEGLSIADLPGTKEYLELLQKHCACETCRHPNWSRDDYHYLATCEKQIFFNRIASIIADILTLSLFHFSETLLVKIPTCRYGLKLQGIARTISGILRVGMQSECDPRDILASARAIVGHQDLDKELEGSDWILTCRKGQAIYPALFDSSYQIEKNGFLRLVWLPGILQHDSDTWKGVIGGQTTWGPDQPAKISPEECLSPHNIFPNLSVEWAVSHKDNGFLEAKLLLKDGERISQTTRNPIDSVLGLQYGLVAEDCCHASGAKLENPDRFCAYVGPEALPRFRKPGNVVVVPVDGADDLRFFSLPGATEERPFVLRKNACLSCSLKVCRKLDISVLIL